jgi:hypothetical protein
MNQSLYCLLIMSVYAQEHNVMLTAGNFYKWVTNQLHGAEFFLRIIVTRLVKKIPCLLRNPKVHYCVHKSPLLFPILSQMNPLHNFPPNFCKKSL